MSFFDLFKKKKEEYDPSNITINDLQVGFVFEYNLSTWVVKEAYEYDWGNQHFSREFKINNGQESLYLSLENDDELVISISKKAKIRSIQEDLPEYIIKNESAPSSLNYQGQKFLLDEENAGYFRTLGETEWSELITWDYYNEDETQIITIEQWDEKSFEASIGNYIKAFEISNILPHS